MAVNIVKLKRDAIKIAGLSKEDVSRMDREELETVIESASKTPKKSVKKKVAKKTVAKKTTKKAEAEVETPKKRGRPKKSEAKVTTTKKAAPKKDGEPGRVAIGKLDYSITDSWNPREGSAVDLIWKALKRHKDNIEKTLENLTPDAKEFVSTTGGKEATRKRLLYRINRTRFEFATRTNQHEKSTNRVEYGMGKYAQANTAKEKPKRGRPAKKAEMKETVKRGRGRPKGSKDKKAKK